VSTYWLADFGNSYLKLGLQRDGVVTLLARIDRRRVDSDPEEAMAGLFDTNPTVSTIVVSTAQLSDRWMVERFFTFLSPGMSLNYLDSKAPLPFRVQYASGMPGPDRLANVFALRALAPGKVAIALDFGTVTHLTVKDAEGNLGGGAIFPGIPMMLTSLVEGTAGRLPEVSAEKVGPRANPLECSSTAAISSGVLYGTVGAAKELVKQIRRLTGVADAPVFFTGGNAASVRLLLPRDYEERPLLTLEGLGHFAEWKRSKPLPLP